MDMTATIREGARAYLVRSGNADLLPVLGLDEEKSVPRRNGRRLCPVCMSLLPDPVTNGGNKPCRKRTCREATR